MIMGISIATTRSFALTGIEYVLNVLELLRHTEVAAVRVSLLS